MNLNDIPLGEDAPGTVHAVIEIPQGSRNKFEYRPEWETFLLDRILAGPLRFPTAYGFIPQTCGLDGDAVDILVVQNEPAITGCVVEARPLGVLRMGRHTGEDVDDKIIAVSANDPMYRDQNSLDDLPEYLREEIDYFFRTYRAMEERDYTTEWGGTDDAHRVIRKRHAEYMKQKERGD